MKTSIVSWLLGTAIAFGIIHVYGQHERIKKAGSQTTTLWSHSRKDAVVQSFAIFVDKDDEVKFFITTKEGWTGIVPAEDLLKLKKLP